VDELRMDVIDVEAFLADAAETVQGKIYALGVGWNIIETAAFPTRHPTLCVGMVLHVPYVATNVPHRLSLRLEDSDGRELVLGNGPDGELRRLQAELSVGRPASLHAGDEQVVPLTMTLNAVEFPKPDQYRFVVAIDAVDVKVLRLRVRLRNR
jgi:hypothetical protein